MKFLETEYERKSFAISTTIMVLLLLLCLFFGLTYMDPPPENGIAINFGTTDFGSGNDNPTETTMTAPQPTESVTEAVNAASEAVLTQEAESVVLPEKKEQKETKPEIKQPVTPKQVEAPKPSKSTTDALTSLLEGPKSDGKTTQSDGTTGKPGNQGQLDGSIYSPSYFGQGGGQGMGNGSYGLKGRSLAKREIVQQKCNESGRVVVQIRVNRNGDVVEAIRAQGTTNPAKCLEDAAVATAKTFKWHPDPNAPEVQIGFIEINFRLGE
jgi:outer membrane biosynthesis protein TonB